MLGVAAAADRRPQKNMSEIIFRCTVSAILGIFTHLALLSIPYFFGAFSLFFQIISSVAVVLIAVIVGQLVRRFLGVRASAPAFLIFHMIFIWLAYIIIIARTAAFSPFTNILFNVIYVFVLNGYFRMLFRDPGSLDISTEEASLPARVRYCKSCKAHILGFDHHCPAFGNCIGQKNHVLFMVLLVGFILLETLYTLIAYQWIKNEIHQASNTEIAKCLVVSTMIFSLVQVLWQLPFFMWHVYCVCFNIKSDEWINWRKYPEFHDTVRPSPSSSEIRFRNPYNKGIYSNLKSFLQL
ncbi:uncharacterized protein LOC141638958 [Silene latifolia]|uniref:uncharacterized protein LOC141638958 n=1 Tax=Silene latifolia TaxID=37657 RepID=UPI003D7755AC